MPSNRFIQAVLLGLFVASGSAALIYEVVWFQQLGLSLGASAISLAIVLTSFMGGMCLGSFVLPAIVSRRLHPFGVYACLEFLLGLCGVAIWFVLPAIGRLYWSFAQTGALDLFLRGLVALVILLPPTMLMGATLPAVSRAFAASPEGVAWLGRFYSANTFGAVLGCLLSGLYLLRVHDVATATTVAVSLNLLVALVAWGTSKYVAYEGSTEPFRLGSVPISPPPGTPGGGAGGEGQSSVDKAPSPPTPTPLPRIRGRGETISSNESQVPDPSSPHVNITSRHQRIVALVIGLSGLTALGSEVVWTRLLALLFGPTVYTFSLILAVFLTGLTLGSAVGAALVRRVKSPGLALAINQLLLAVAIPFAGIMIVQVLPYWWSDDHDELSLRMKILCDVARAAAALLPATLLWGSSFPLAIAAVSDDHRDHGIVVGRLYAANTLGAVAGALGISLLAIPLAGTRIAIQSLTLLAGCSGLLMLIRRRVGAPSRGAPERNSGRIIPEQLRHAKAPESVSNAQALPCSPAQSTLGSGSARRTYLAASLVLLTVAVGCCVVFLVPVIPNGLLAWGRFVDEWPNRNYVFVAEGMDSAIVIADRSEDGMRSFHVAGKVEASTLASDMRTQRLLGHLPAMVHGRPVKVLVICCGSGMTAGAILQHKSVEKLTLCEIERQVTVAARKYFGPQNHGALDDPRLEVVIDDGRHFLATTREKFDIISTDPIHPWVRGAASLYTQEFYQLCREHLNPGGVVTQWVPLYESSEAAVKCELATLLKVFPHAALYSGQGNLYGYDMIAVGSLDESRLDPALVAIEWNTSPEIRNSLVDVGYIDPETFQGAFVAYGSELTDWLSTAEINRDSNLRLQYLAGLTQAAASEQGILDALIKHRR